MSDKPNVLARIDVKLKGIFPLLMQAMTPEMIESVLIRGERPQKPKDAPLTDIAEKCLYKNDEGKIGIPQENLFACLREAGRRVKFDGRRSISTSDSTLLPSFLTINEGFFILDRQEWVPDVRRGQMQNGTTVGIVRPKFKDWGFAVSIEVDLTDGMTVEKVRSLFEIAGKSIGLCAFRPQKNGPFGRFCVETWDVKALLTEDDLEKEQSRTA